MLQLQHADKTLLYKKRDEGEWWAPGPAVRETVFVYTGRHMPGGYMMICDQLGAYVSTELFKNAAADTYDKSSLTCLLVHVTDPQCTIPF